MPLITHFVDSLSVRKGSDSVTNPYLDGDKAYNLELYLRSIVKQPHVLFIGEAPGYHGCAKTGIPFTSHVQLQYGVHPIIDAMLPRIKVCNDNDSESTATCFWKTMKKSAMSA